MKNRAPWILATLLAASLLLNGFVYEQGHEEGYLRGFQDATKIGFRAEGAAYEAGRQSVIRGES